MHRVRHQRNKVPERIMRRGCLRRSAVRLRLYRMNQVGEFNRVLNEKHRNVIANQVEISFAGVKLHGEAADISRQITRAALARYRGETHKDRSSYLGIIQKGGLRIFL